MKEKKLSVAGLLAQVVLTGLVTVTPWMFGGVYVDTQVWLFAGVLIALACWLTKELTSRRHCTVLPMAIVPLACAVGIGILQLIPLQGRTRALLSPFGTQLREQLQSEESPSEGSLVANLGIGARAERQPISLYPASTRRDLALFGLGAAAFVLGAALFCTPQAQMWLCGLIALNGAALAFFAMVQRLTCNNLLYWTFPPVQGGSPFGPFVNQNNAGGFLNLCLAGAVGSTVWAVDRARSSGSSTEAVPLTENRTLLARAWWRSSGLLARLEGAVLFTVAFTVCIVAGILCSLSRGAGIAMIGATIVGTLAVFCARRRRLRVWGIGIVAMAGLALVGWVGMRDSVHARFATLLDQEAMSQHGLLLHWPSGLNAVPDFWLAGSGLGTYRYVYGLYQERLQESWFYHAENQYLETLVDGGIVALGLMLSMIALVGIAGWRLLRTDSDASTFAFGIVGIFMLSGQAIAVLFDFGLYIPANMLLFALLCGAVSGRAAELAKRERSAERRLPTILLALPGGRWVTTSLAALLLAANVLGCLEIRRAAATEVALRGMPLDEMPAEALPDVLMERLGRLEAAIEDRGDDADAQHGAASLWTELYRARAFEQLRAEGIPGSDDDVLWLATSPMVIHGRAHDFARHDLSSELEKLRAEPVIRDHLHKALARLVLARRACPLLPEVHLAVAELCFLTIDPADDQVHIDRARRLVPADPGLLFRCGLLELQAGRCDSAYEDWRQSLTLSLRCLDDVLAIAGQDLERPGVIEKLLPDSPGLLVQLARQRYRAEQHAPLRRLLVRRAEALAEQGALPQDELYYLRGSIFGLKEVYPKAIENYARAVALRPEDVVWRYELALLLEREGRFGEAHRQATRCARLDPRRREYRDLLQRIHQTRLR